MPEDEKVSVMVAFSVGAAVVLFLFVLLGPDVAVPDCEWSPAARSWSCPTGGPGQ